MSLSERTAITGIGETAYSRISGKSVVALQMEASLAAIALRGTPPASPVLNLSWAMAAGAGMHHRR